MMSDDRFLKWLIRRAVRRGYAHPGLHKMYKSIDRRSTYTNSCYQILFDVDFARAIWGEKDHYNGSIKGYCCPEWHFRQRKMVTHSDPIQYLKQTYRAEGQCIE